MRVILAAAAAMNFGPMLAEASEKRFVADLAASTMLIDRGEQLGRETLEATIGVEVDVGAATVYGAFYRILPVGPDQGAFDDEADFVIGMGWEGDGYSADISANWLTFPGQDDEASLELAAEIGLDLPLTPTLAGFYDVDLEDWGLELTAGPEWERGDWIVYALGRAGFVRAGDGSGDRSYGGVEAGAARALSDAVELGFYVRTEAADTPSFVRSIDAGQVTDFRKTGVAAGVTLSISR